MNFPVSIDKFLQKNGIAKFNLHYLVTSNDGVIVDVGNSMEILISSPLCGHKVAELIPVFEGVFPVESTVYLPNMQLFHHNYYNLYLLPHKNKVWILMNNVSDQVQKVKQGTELKDEDPAIGFSILESLDYFVLKEIDGHRYKPVTAYLDWTNALFEVQTETIDLEDSFPFLSFFVEHAEETQNQCSGVWTQSTLSGDEIHLNAWIKKFEQETYLVIQAVKIDSQNQNNIIQLARENSLAYEQLNKTKEQLQELVILKDQFVSIVSHDLRSPISTLADGVSFILDDLSAAKPFDDTHREIVVQVRAELIRLLDYNNKLYNWTKLNLDSIELNLSEVSLDLMVANLNGQFDARLIEKNIKMILLVNAHVELNTDYVLFHQAVSNLIDNAIKFSHPNSEIHIVVDAESISIKDFGTGLSKDKIEEIKKGHSLKSSLGTGGEQGTGLGLSIVSRIIKTLGFKLNIVSKINEGTTFIITF
ncbi:MAG: sensor histidine kinase [Prolixibacteraceae bacterium]